MNRRLIGGLLVVGLACQREQPAKTPLSVQPPAAPLAHDAAPVVLAAPGPDGSADAGAPLSPIEEAMAKLVKAVLAKDPAGVLACFSKKKPIWFISHTVDDKTSKLRFTYDAIAKGMKENGDFWYYFFDDESELKQAIEDHPRWPHTKNGTFVPPGNENDPDSAPAGVRWRKEGDVFVIDALLDSGA